MKILLSAFAVAMLAGCATSPVGDSLANQGLDDLRKPMYLRTERFIPLTFPQIQMALIRHERLCGTAPAFAVTEGQTAYGTIIQKQNPTDSLDQAILVDLTWLQPTWSQETRVKAEVFSRNGGSAVSQRIGQIFATLANPDACPGDTEADQPTKQ
ncbi:MAG: hypothetical protein KA735_12095 [Burkholderiaceae bacterium]|nr:hypothetical protein [Burkholderiaceae bacterium]